MAITLPDASTANTDSNATIAADTVAAQTAFIASTTVLINDAIENGLFLIQPYLPPLVTSDYVTTYFTGLGYSVLYPIVIPGPFDTFFSPPAGFPEVIPPGWTHNPTQIPARIQISWPNP